ncbi:OmpA family protein [Mucilaginibacter sp. HMF5004]|uniref:OmpA family protein n=1 Tax=Mucilaginibacter rivuli TaxID=2857527 RepID=UPI001C5CD2F0|nr:OmpA family protein [Mucilaginibacter rivuli]MBW4890233.1 OmpA family protein [Mucilaginibacter rivuli]
MKRCLIAFCLLTGLLLHSPNATAQHYLEQADKQYNLFNYSKAIALYKQAYKTDSSFYIAEHLANSYRLVQDYKNAESWYAITTTMRDANKAENFLRYAQVLQNNANYAEAKKQFIKYYALSPEIDQTQLNVWLTACDSAIVWMNNPRPFTLTNELALNSPASDWGAVNYNNTIVFASDRKKAAARGAFLRFDTDKPVNRERYLWTGNDYLRLYQGETGGAADTKLFAVTIGANDYHMGPASFTVDGNEMYFTLTRLPAKQKDTAAITTIKPEIFWSKKADGTRWSKPLPFAYNNPKYSAGDPYIAPDGKTLYFVSDMPGGKGGTDIYYCKKGVADNWEQPVNLKSVNTTGNERTAVLYAGNLYFSSDNNTGMGGLDIYKAVPRGGSFAKAQNMGYPVNSPQDDFAFIPVSETRGYLSSNRTGGAGSDDIYSYVQNPVPAYVFEGVVYDKQSNEAIAGSKVIFTGNNKVLTTRSDNAGKFTFSTGQKGNYTLRGEKQGYLSDNQTLSTINLKPGNITRKNLYLDKIVLNKPVRLDHLYLDITEAYITDDARSDMEKLIRLLKDNPAVAIEIGAHTDSRGNAAANKELSQACADVVVKYIVDKGGINPKRIKARGYGATQLLNGCKVGIKCTEREYQINRRVEFKITNAE